MKLIILLPILITTSLVAQNSSTNQSQYYLFRVQHNVDNPFSYEKTLLEQAQTFKPKTITKTTFYKKSKKPTVINYTFNEFGKVSKRETPKSSTEISYIQDTLPSAMKVTGKNERFTTMRYVDNKKVLQETFGPKKLISRTVIQYNTDDKIIFSSVTAKSTFSMSYEYEGKKLSNQRFMKNNRIKKEWDYHCKPEGESVEEKNLSTVCNYVEESNDGSYINFSRKEEKGKVILSKTYFTKDSVWFKSESFKDETTLTYSTTKSDDVSESKWYNSKGKVTSQHTTRFDSQKRVVEQQSARGNGLKKVYSTYYSYDEKGMLLSEKGTYNGKKIREESYVYEM